MSLTATISIPGSLSAARNKFRPMRPKPLIPTLTGINIPPLFIITGLIQIKNLTRVARRCQSQQLANADNLSHFWLASKNSDWKTRMTSAAPRIPKRAVGSKQ
jgi:hypothetical protein